MVRLNDDAFSNGLETAKLLLGHPRFSTALAKAIRQEGGADRAVDALVRELLQRDLMNGSLAMTVDDQLRLLAEAVRQEGWERWMPSGYMQRLQESAPPWPSGPLALRSLRIRFGKGCAGVAQTYEAHITRLVRIYGKRFHRWHSTTLDDTRLTLVAGEATHRPTVEWIVADLDTARKRPGIEEARGPLSLADELLVIGWMFPKLIEATRQSGNVIPGFFAGGYQVGEGIVPGIQRNRIANDDTAKFNPGRDEIEFIGDRMGNTNSAMSVPMLRL